MQVQNQTSNADMLNQIDQQISQTLGKSDPQLANALEQFLAKLLGQDQNQSPGSGNSPASGSGQGGMGKLGQDIQNLSNDLSNNAQKSQVGTDISNVINDAMSMMSQGALPA
jgi:hypothetical protein